MVPVMSRAEATPGQLGRRNRGGGRLAASVLDAVGERDARADRFAELSAFLTGYGRVELTGTGLTGLYLQTLDAVLPAGTVDELLEVFGRLPAGRDAAAGAVILDDLKLGPVARNIILLWYCGTWTALSDAWHAAYGGTPHDISRVVSAQSCPGALQRAAGAYPAGARQRESGARP